jgi:glycosyltransferase involved in cell wall biosynthesis
MNIKEAVVILDVNRAIEAGGMEVLLRHAEYGRQLLDLSNNRISLVIIGSANLQNLASSNLEPNLIVLSRNGAGSSHAISWINLNRILKENFILPRLFVVGDPWKSGIVGLLIKLKEYGTTPFQLQIHADFSARKWKNQNLKYYFKFVVAKFVTLRYENLRLVSKSQARNINASSSKRVDIIPVQSMATVSNLGPKKSTGTLTFGFFGRLHLDRGTKKLIEIFPQILSENKQVRLIIGGDGPEKSRIQRHLEEHFPSQVKLLGHVVRTEADLFWEEIDVLVSLAPFESYGRTLRESLLRARPVLAIPSSGALDLLECAGQTWIQFIDPEELPHSILAKANSLISLTHRRDISKTLTEFVDSKRLIAQSWLEIIDQSI